MKTLVLALLALGLAPQTDGDKALTHVDKPPAKRRPGAPGAAQLAPYSLSRL